MFAIKHVSYGISSLTYIQNVFMLLTHVQYIIWKTYGIVDTATYIIVDTIYMSDTLV
jgi:hypothetical protein